MAAIVGTDSCFERDGISVTASTADRGQETGRPEGATESSSEAGHCGLIY